MRKNKHIRQHFFKWLKLLTLFGMLIGKLQKNASKATFGTMFRVIQDDAYQIKEI